MRYFVLLIVMMLFGIFGIAGILLGFAYWMGFMGDDYKIGVFWSIISGAAFAGVGSIMILISLVAFTANEILDRMR